MEKAIKNYQRLIRTNGENSLSTLDPYLLALYAVQLCSHTMNFIVPRSNHLSSNYVVDGTTNETITIDFVMSTWKPNAIGVNFERLKFIDTSFRKCSIWCICRQLARLLLFSTSILVLKVQKKKKWNECKPNDNDLNCIRKQMNLNSQFYSFVFEFAPQFQLKSIIRHAESFILPVSISVILIWHVKHSFCSFRAGNRHEQNQIKEVKFRIELIILSISNEINSKQEKLCECIPWNGYQVKLVN